MPDETDRDHAVLSLLPKARRLAQARGVPPYGVLDAEDLEQEGLLGAIHALPRYNAARGASFATYVDGRMRGAMLDALRAADALSRRARHCGLTDWLAGALYRRHAFRQDLHRRGRGAALDDSAIFHQLVRALRQAIAALPVQQQTVLRLWYGEALTMKQIGAQLGVSESRISQVHTAAIARLRRKLKAWNEEE